MNKKIRQIGGGIILLILIIAVCFLMFGGNINNQNNENIETQNEIEIDNGEISGENNKTESNNLEQDVMSDLEDLFNGGNGYEDIEGDFGFIDPNAE